MNISGVGQNVPLTTTNKQNPAVLAQTETAPVARPQPTKAEMMVAARAASMQLEPAERQNKIDEIASRYDVNNISPKEIDSMYEALWKAGYEPEGDLMMLATRGAEFQSHIAHSLAESRGTTVDEAALERRFNQKSNLVAQLQDALTYAKNHGDPTQAWEGMLSMLDDLKESSAEHHRREQGPVAPQTMSSLLSAQEAYL